MIQLEAPVQDRAVFARAMADQGWPCVTEVVDLDDSALVNLAVDVEATGRRVDALRAAVAGEIADRSRRELGHDGLAARLGCRTGVELVQRVTGAAGVTVNRRIRVGKATRAGRTLTGEPVPPRFAAVASALGDGLLGFDAAATIVDTLNPAVAVAGSGAVAAAEGEIVAGAVAPGPLDPTPLDADSVRLQATVWHAALDPDGPAPDEHDEQRRFLRLSAPRHGLIPVSGLLLPEVAGALQQYTDACTNPRTLDPSDPSAGADPRAGTDPRANGPSDPGVGSRAPGVDDADDAGMTGTAGVTGTDDVDGVADQRSRAQKLHDVFATIIAAAARAADAPSVAGNPPTLVVAVRDTDLLTGHGTAYTESGIPVSLTAAQQIGCDGAIQRVFLGDGGQILGLEAPQRCFTGPQRRAIALRDGGCVIPGCHVPAPWCEIHHVQSHVERGPTHTDNGVALCWHHHRTIDRSGWQIRMLAGLPQIKAPPWLDPGGHWRPATGSPTRIAIASGI